MGSCGKMFFRLLNTLGKKVILWTDCWKDLWGLKMVLNASLWLYSGFHSSACLHELSCGLLERCFIMSVNESHVLCPQWRDPPFNLTYVCWRERGWIGSQSAVLAVSGWASGARGLDYACLRAALQTPRSAGQLEGTTWVCLQHLYFHYNNCRTEITVFFNCLHTHFLLSDSWNSKHTSNLQNQTLT